MLNVTSVRAQARCSSASRACARRLRLGDQDPLDGCGAGGRRVRPPVPYRPHTLQGKQTADLFDGDIVVTASGDPSLGSRRFFAASQLADRLAGVLAVRGIRRWRGHVRVDGPGKDAKAKAPEAAVEAKTKGVKPAKAGKVAAKPPEATAKGKAPKKAAGDTSLPLLEAFSREWHGAVRTGHGREDVSATFLALGAHEHP